MTNRAESATGAKTYTVKATTKKGGKVTTTSTHVASKDDRTMTVIDTGANDNGVTYKNTLVFHKR